MRVMISHKPGEKIVWIGVDLNDSGDFIWFKRDCNSAGDAAAIRAGIEEKFKSRIRDIRYSAFHRGRESMRDKSKRVTGFNSCFNEESVGYDAHSGCDRDRK